MKSLWAGIICSSSSPAGAGFSFMGKKDGYRSLNDITAKNRYHFLLMAIAFELLQGAKLDLHNVYISLAFGREMNRRRSGLTNAPAIFQALINDVFRDFLNSMLVYLDYILIYSQALEEHQHHVCQVLQRLMENCSSKQRNASSTPCPPCSLGSILAPKASR